MSLIALDSFLEVFGNQKSYMYCYESTFGNPDCEVSPDYLEEGFFIGRGCRVYNLPPASTQCPGFCADMLPNNIGFLDLARECGKKIAKLDERLRRSRLRSMDPSTTFNDLMDAMDCYVYLTALIGNYLAYDQRSRAYQSALSFYSSVKGYRAWFLFPGLPWQLYSRYKMLKLSIKPVRHECQHRDVQGWVLMCSSMLKLASMP
jgi:hypothetical protein